MGYWKETFKRIDMSFSCSVAYEVSLRLLLVHSPGWLIGGEKTCLSSLSTQGRSNLELKNGTSDPLK